MRRELVGLQSKIAHVSIHTMAEFVLHTWPALLQREQARENELRRELVELQSCERTSQTEVVAKEQDAASCLRELERLKSACSAVVVHIPTYKPVSCVPADPQLISFNICQRQRAEVRRGSWADCCAVLTTALFQTAAARLRQMDSVKGQRLATLEQLTGTHRCAKTPL